MGVCVRRVLAHVVWNGPAGDSHSSCPHYTTRVVGMATESSDVIGWDYMMEYGHVDDDHVGGTHWGL